MSQTMDLDAVTRGLRTLFSLLTREQLQQLTEIKPDAALDERVRYLAERANEGELSAEEEAEYLGYIEATSLVAVLQAAARRPMPAIRRVL